MSASGYGPFESDGGHDFMSSVFDEALKMAEPLVPTMDKGMRAFSYKRPDGTITRVPGRKPTMRMCTGAPYAFVGLIVLGIKSHLFVRDETLSVAIQTIQHLLDDVETSGWFDPAPAKREYLRLQRVLLKEKQRRDEIDARSFVVRKQGRIVAMSTDGEKGRKHLKKMYGIDPVPYVKKKSDGPKRVRKKKGSNR